MMSYLLLYFLFLLLLQRGKKFISLVTQLYVLTYLVLVYNSCKEGALRHTSMDTDILQICSGNEWKYICAKIGYNLWSKNEARVACYQMGMVWKEGSGIVVVLIFYHMIYYLL